MSDRDLLRTVADRVEGPGRRQALGHAANGSTEHVAEARAASAALIAAFSPALTRSLATWLRSAADGDAGDPAAVAFARSLLDRLT